MQPSKKNIIIVDYGLGNLRSLFNAFKMIGSNATLSGDPTIISNADAIVIPGVGAFGKAMENINHLGLFNPIQSALTLQKPVLGICLGMQILFDQSEESPKARGFSYFPGWIKKIDSRNKNIDRLPHIGWATPNAYEKNASLFNKSILSHLVGQKQYFVHSFCAEPSEESVVLATTKYAEKEFVCAVQKNNVIGMQFHPEKSREPGLIVLENFVKLIQES